MRYLQFRIGEQRYGIPARRVVQVLPLVELKPVPGAPSGLAGLIIYRGRAVPAIDLSHALTGKAAARKMSTRILLVEAGPGGGAGPLVALIAEHATGIITVEQGVSGKEGSAGGQGVGPGPMLAQGGAIICLMDEQKLLPEALWEYAVKQTGQPQEQR